MQQVSAETAAAIESPERVLFHRFTIDWDRDGVDDNLDELSGRVGAARADHALATDLPEQVRVVPGSAAAQLTIELGAGNYGPHVPVEILGTTRASAGVTATTSISIARPDGVREGELVLVAFAYSEATWLVSPNVEWGKVGLQRDNLSNFSKVVECVVFARRATADEPAVYTWTSLQSIMYVAFAVRVGGPGVAGVHRVSSRGVGHDADPAAVHPALLENRPIKPSVPNCVGLTLFATNLGATTTGAWAPQTGATELGDMTTTGAGDNIAAALHSLPMTTPGTYRPQATASATSETVVAISIALMPALGGDDSQHAAWTFSELNPGSPYAGKIRENRPTRWDVGVATGPGVVDYVPVFNGFTVGSEVSSRNRRATFTGIDARELLRKPIGPYISLVLAEFPLPMGTETLPAWPGLESTWIVSKALTYALISDGSGELHTLGPGNSGLTYTASPEMGPVTISHVPCHGSLYPFTGGLDYAYVQRQDNTQHRCTFGAGPYVAATDPAPIGGSYNGKFSPNGLGGVFDSNAQQIARLWGMFRVPRGGTASWGTTKDAFGSAIGAAGHLTIDTLGVIRLQLTRNTGTTRTVVGPTLPDDSAWHSVGVYWSSAAGSATFYLDGTETVVAFATWANTALTNSVPFQFLTLTAGAQAAELMLDGGMTITASGANGILTAESPWPDELWEPTAFIDKSDNLLEAVQPIDPALDAWGLLTQLADTEYAAVFCDAQRRVHFRTRRSDGTDAGQAVVRTLQAVDALRDVDYVNGVSQVVNSVSVPYVTFSYVIAGKAYEPQGAVRLPAKVPIRFEWQFPGIPFGVGTLGLTHVGYNRKADGSGSVVSNASISWGVGISGFDGYAELTNTNPYDVYAVTTGGAPGFHVTASWAVPSSDAPPVIQSDSTSIARYRPQPLGVPASPWRQNINAASALGAELLANLRNPVPVLRNVTIVGDPRLELGDLVRIVDANGLALDGQFRIAALQPQVHSTGAFTQTITARLAAPVAVFDVSEWGDGHIWGIL